MFHKLLKENCKNVCSCFLLFCFFFPFETQKTNKAPPCTTLNPDPECGTCVEDSEGAGTVTAEDDGTVCHGSGSCMSGYCTCPNDNPEFNAGFGHCDTYGTFNHIWCDGDGACDDCPCNCQCPS